ncbi:isoprenyl transferase [Corynebacterium sp. 320]|uniref:Isoprenyl transferase n=1 Tax=Corynebacterium zhongnanshanii TaxID=2768834 RepID=A0ABQ6VIK4_9CORY|nr:MULTISPECIES: isoprenyl transferase [Corynebacterium]KAB1504549.1 isoprenyl transferase [Corynebacterium sp. 320]KAB1553390.1 isoprenyl transferase [Corynebacterium sp. 321]KAB1554499.1 isoprenyl transferase [Corynebacterium sp. 319]KAB3523638.1 isoprenyl transferase [Corynebacterium zhongnanshanii]KAB3528685.1 isoprenyl transferase [Corynebacterium sp. 250]
MKIPAVKVPGVKVPSLLYPAYEAQLVRALKGKSIPQHVAIMCDGNRRWARENGFTDVSHGHRVGAKKIAEMCSWCDEMGIETVTVYLLSTENLQRSPEELSLLCDIIGDVADELAGDPAGFRLRTVGQLDLLPDTLRSRLQRSQEKAAEHTGVRVNVAVGYGGRQEIVDAVQKLVDELVADGVAPEELSEKITAQALGDHMYTSGQPDPDLVIRTSGEQRLSGFLLWQSAYSEIWFTDTYWPAFRRVDFLRALRDYSQRHRRFGK